MKTRQIITGALLLLSLWACKTGKKDTKPATTSDALASGELILKGQIAGIDNGYLELLYSQDDTNRLDSIKVTNGKFSFTKEIKEPQQVALRIAQTRGGELSFFADPGMVDIKAHKDSLWAGTVVAGPTQALYKQLETGVKDIMKKGEELYAQHVEAQGKNDAATMQKIEQQFMGLQQEAQQYAIDFAHKNRASVLAPYLGLMYLSEGGNETKMKTLYDTLTPAVQQSFYGKKISEALSAAQKTGIGATAPDFTLPDPNGKPVSLSSYKGKYVLIDFWASWCGPCRQENPNVVKAWKLFHPKGLEILGVSLDQDKDEWVKAIAEDRLDWTQISDLKYWDSEAASLYGIKSIPTNFLLDKEGKIIGKNLRGAELQSKLAEVFK